MYVRTVSAIIYHMKNMKYYSYLSYRVLYPVMVALLINTELNVKLLSHMILIRFLSYGFRKLFGFTSGARAGVGSSPRKALVLPDPESAFHLPRRFGNIYEYEGIRKDVLVQA